MKYRLKHIVLATIITSLPLFAMDEGKKKDWQTICASAEKHVHGHWVEFCINGSQSPEEELSAEQTHIIKEMVLQPVFPEIASTRITSCQALQAALIAKKPDALTDLAIRSRFQRICTLHYNCKMTDDTNAILYNGQIMSREVNMETALAFIEKRARDCFVGFCIDGSSEAVVVRTEQQARIINNLNPISLEIVSRCETACQAFQAALIAKKPDALTDLTIRSRFQRVCAAHYNCKINDSNVISYDGQIADCVTTLLQNRRLNKHNS